MRVGDVVKSRIEKAQPPHAGGEAKLWGHHHSHSSRFEFRFLFRLFFLRGGGGTLVLSQPRNRGLEYNSGYELVAKYRLKIS